MTQDKYLTKNIVRFARRCCEFEIHKTGYRHGQNTCKGEYYSLYRGADKSLTRPGRKQARKHVKDARDLNNIETRAVFKFFLQGKAPKEIHAILTETLACFFLGRAKDLSAPLYNYRAKKAYN